VDGTFSSPVKGHLGVRLELYVTYHKRRKHLPIIVIGRAA
jgi:hypothetical protein